MQTERRPLPDRSTDWHDPSPRRERESLLGGGGQPWLGGWSSPLGRFGDG